MLIVVSPAKKLDFKSKNRIEKYTFPGFLDKSAELAGLLRGFSPGELKKLMNVSDDIANLTFERFSEWEAGSGTENSRQAILAFRGDVYRGMEPESFTGVDMDFAQDHLRMISGLYGLLRPLDLIRPYRLEMGTDLKTGPVKSLYAYWSDTITNALNDELNDHEEKVIINLASQEYFRAVNPERLQGSVVTPVFKEYRDGGYRVIGIIAKKSRGRMTRFIIKNKLERVDEIKHFNLDGYAYDDNMSSDKEWVFTR
jgi:uncharacterized protein